MGKKVNKLNEKLLILYKLPITRVYSEASNSRLGICFTIKRKKLSSHKTFSEKDESKSSTWREMEAISFPLCLLPKNLNERILFWHTDNYAAAKFVESGSKKLI